MKTFMDWCARDTRRIDWYLRALEIQDQRREEAEAWRRDTEQETGKLPDIWISQAPLMSRFQAGRNRDEKNVPRLC